MCLERRRERVIWVMMRWRLEWVSRRQCPTLTVSQALTGHPPGIHNEPGVLKMPLPTSQELVATMLRMVYDTSDEDRAFLDFKLDGKDEVVLMVNNL